MPHAGWSLVGGATFLLCLPLSGMMIPIPIDQFRFRFFGWINLIKAPARWELFYPRDTPWSGSAQHLPAWKRWKHLKYPDSGAERFGDRAFFWKNIELKWNTHPTILLLFTICLPIVVTWKMFFNWCLVIAANTIGHKKRSKFGVHDLTHALHGVRPCRGRTCGALSSAMLGINMWVPLGSNSQFLYVHW